MTLLALIVALLVEQVHPLPVQRLVLAPLQRLTVLLRERFDDGSPGSGQVVWVLLVLGPAILTALLHFALWELQPLLAFLFNVGVLYLTMGFRQESHFFTDIHLALRMGELDRARALISEWRGESHNDASECEICRLAIEQALVAAHRNVFGVSFWFIVLPGPSGAVLYRMARYFAENGLSQRVAAGSDGVSFQLRALEWLDWLPVRLTALGFSVAGNFEDAVLCWRTQALQWPRRLDGILIASGAGASRWYRRGAADDRYRACRCENHVSDAGEAYF